VLFIGYLYLNRVENIGRASKGPRSVRQDLGKENEHRFPAHGGWAEEKGRVVHHSGEKETCSALYKDGAIPLPQPVELCTTDDYNYSVSCTFTNLQLHFLLHYYGQLRCLI